MNYLNKKEKGNGTTMRICGAGSGNSAQQGPATLGPYPSPLTEVKIVQLFCGWASLMQGHNCSCGNISISVSGLAKLAR